MKKNTFLPIFLLGLFMGIAINNSGQATIWSEDFSAYVENTGIEGPGAVNIGDYPAGVTKWTLNVSGCSLYNNEDYIKTDYEKLKSQDLDGPAVWQSESIDLSAYSKGATFSIKFYEYSSLEADDYIDVHYQLDGGDFVLIPNWNGHGSDIHTLIDDFSKDTVVQSVSACNNIVLKVVFDNNSGAEEFQMDDVFIYPNMEYVSSTTTQNSNKIAVGKTNRQIIGMEIVTTETESPISITQFTINANGSSTPVSTNIENAKIYCTGTDNTFATDTQFGSTYISPTTTNFDITGTQQLSEGTNYFWLTFDTKTGATIGELIDAECVSFVVEGSTETPTITAPAGSRTIAAPLSGDYTIGAKSNYASFTAAANDLNDLGISGTVSFAVASGTYTEQISLLEIVGTSATDTIVFQSNSGNRADVVLQYEPTSDPANHILKFDGTDYITFQNMTLNNTGTSAYGRVIVFAGATNNINITGCNMNGRDANHENNIDYTVIKGESGTSNMASNITFDNDTIRYGSYGLYFDGGDNNNLETGIKISYSVFEDFYYAGIFLYYQDSVVVHRNKLTGKGVYDYEYGMFLMYCYGAYEITANMVFLSADVVNCGIKLLECHASAARYALVANNYFSQVSTGGAYGIDVSDCSYQKIYHNSINMRSSAKSGSGGKSYPTVGCYLDCLYNPKYINIRMENNIVEGPDDLISVTQDAVNQNYLLESDNNVWYGTGSGFGNWGDEPCDNLYVWKGLSGLDGGSVETDPEFVSSEVSDITNENLGEFVPLKSEVPKDIRDTRRADNTTPGATILTNRWLGGHNTDTENPQNWSLGVVPNANHNVVITAGEIHNPVLTNDLNCNSLTIEGENTDLNLNGNTINVGGNYKGNGQEASIHSGTLNFNGDGSCERWMDGIGDNSINAKYVDVKFDDNSNTATSAKLEAKSITTDPGSTINLNGNDCVISEDAVFSDGNLTNDNKISFIGSSNSTVEFNDSYRYNHVEIDKDLSTVEVIMTPRGKIYKFKNFTVKNGKVVATGNEVDITEDADFSGGWIDVDKITYSGSSNSAVTPGDERQDNVVVNKDSPGVELQITPTGRKYKIKAFTLERGTVVGTGSEFDFSEDADLAGGDYSADKTTFSGTGNSELTTGGNILESVVVDKDGNAEVNLQDALVAAVLKILKGRLNVSSHVEADYLKIGATGISSVVQVEPGKGIISKDSIIIKSGGELKVKSDEDDEGYVIPKRIIKEGTGKITVERYVTNGQWHLISAPVANATVNSLYFNGSPDVWVKKFHESGNPGDWEYITDLSTPMPFGKGFGYWVDVPTDVTALFEGDLLTDDLILNSSSTPPLAFSDIDHGYNLAGNPYSCALDWDIGTWERTNLEGSVWVWQDAGAGDGSGNYLVRNLAGEGSLTDGIIPMCQGFFVRATTSAPVLTIPTDARVHSTQPYYKDGEREVAPHIILNVSNNINHDEVWIGFDEETTTGFDYGRDVSKLFGSTDVPQLYLNEQGYQLSIDILPELIVGEERTVTMGFEAATSGTYNITASSLEYLSETDIILEDLKTGILHDLHIDPEYSYTGTQEDDPDRFLVHFFYIPTEINNPIDEENNTGVNIYAYDKAVYIKCDGETARQTGTVEIYDMYGRLLINKNLESGSFNKIDVAMSNGYVVVRVVKDGVVTVGKVLVR